MGGSTCCTILATEILSFTDSFAVAGLAQTCRVWDRIRPTTCFDKHDTLWCACSPEIQHPHKGEIKEREGASTATAGLNLLATLLGAAAKDDAGDGEGDEGAGGAKRRGSRRDSFKINLFPDEPFDAAQAKGGDDEVQLLCRDLPLVLLFFFFLNVSCNQAWLGMAFPSFGSTAVPFFTATVN